jgi:hypothetical protein
MTVLLASLLAINLLLFGAKRVWASTDHKPQTYLGLTAKQWHGRAVARTKERNRLRASAKRLRTIVRYEIQVKGTHPLERAFLCIKSFEGAWRSNTGNGYYGGMQMDMSFQRSYGPEFLRAWGTADNWPISVQLAVAMRAYLSGRGFYPWPNTARFCGLIG